ncbi:MAG: Yip1 family protein [Spirochaetota bacterium]|nr:Yip1 family protein [Spirochaetota bacterium]OPZ36920.1 MAG: Yip1 domain protein [Spirochaetes bacterium ADurb.BinA120]HPI15722.1 Yip1 family protein [Spirochaetota bacterium]HPV97563.1 Yip1 family protein [Spirochaetota bacterium]
MAEGGFDFKKFIDDSKAVLTTPKEYFSSMPTSGGFVEPLIKATIYGTIAGVISLIWSMLKLTAAAGAFGGMIGGGVGVMALIGSIIGAIIGLFVGGVILLIVSAICGGNTNYEANVRVTAALMVLSPVNALLSFTSGINLWLGGLIGLAVSLYGLYLLYHAIVGALKGKEGTAKVITIVLAALVGLVLISALTCAKAVSTIGDKYQADSEKYLKQNEETLKDFNKMMEELKKQSDQ